MKEKKKIYAAAAAVLALVLVIAAAIAARPRVHDTAAFQEKIGLLAEYALADWVGLETGVAPAGRAGNAVFVSVSDGASRAAVYTGTGGTLEGAWDAAAEAAGAALRKTGLEPKWVKADVLYVSESVKLKELGGSLAASREGFFRYGAAFDAEYKTALLEAELNSAGIYDYEAGSVDLKALNAYLKASGRDALATLPKECTVFQSIGWICDEENEVRQLGAGGLDYGRRQVELLDGAYAGELLLNASAYLAGQVKEDGAFVYGVDAKTGEEIEDYNMLRHAGAVLSLLAGYRYAPDEALAGKIEQAVGYMLDAVVYDGEGRGYLYEAKDDEIKLGGSGIAAAALAEYMDVFGNERYREECVALGEGILSMLDEADGTYYHVLNGDFTRKEEYRTVSYDGEATYALCRIYGLTGDARWLEAARSAAGHFIKAGYTQYKDHWVAYTMNEITKYVTDEPEYYAFALANVKDNIDEIARRETTYPAYLELLLTTFEVYDRMVESGGSAEGFDLRAFLGAVYKRAERQLDGYFYPESAMYMKDPQRVLGTFMARQEGFRVRIDDVQHNISGYALYCANYEKLVRYGMLVCAGVY